MPRLPSRTEVGGLRHADGLVRAKAGYVEVTGGPLCNNCEYADKKERMCAKFGFKISLKDGCCDYWESAVKGARDWRKELMEKSEGNVQIEKFFIAIPSVGGPLAKYIEEEEE